MAPSRQEALSYKAPIQNVFNSYERPQHDKKSGECVIAFMQRSETTPGIIHHIIYLPYNGQTSRRNRSARGSISLVPYYYVTGHTHSSRHDKATRTGHRAYSQEKAGLLFVGLLYEYYTQSDSARTIAKNVSSSPKH